jgi:hypothetical protein
MASTVEDEEREKLAQWRAEQISLLRNDSRMSLPFGMRLPLAATLSFVSGMALGISHGSQTAGLRFRAENAHRLPTTPTGWYLYHKSKNYHMALGGVKEGMKMGAKVSFWTAGFFGIEEMFDRYRGTKDFVNTVIASLSIAGGFSLWSMHHSPSPPIQTNHHRPIPRHNSSENGEDRTCYRLSLWTCARCFRSEPRAKTEICGLHTTKRKTKSRSRTGRNAMMCRVISLMINYRIPQMSPSYQIAQLGTMDHLPLPERC